MSVPFTDFYRRATAAIHKIKVTLLTPLYSNQVPSSTTILTKTLIPKSINALLFLFEVSVWILFFSPFTVCPLFCQFPQLQLLLELIVLRVFNVVVAHL